MIRAGLALVTTVLALAPQSASAAEAWVWPVRGEVITPYRNGSNPYEGGQHRGIDIAARAGTPVVAAAGGTVTFAGQAGSSGLTVAIRTADGRFDTSYLHLSNAAVREGDRVGRGARIAAVGTSGTRSAAAAHLHLGVRDAGSRHAYHDPLRFLPVLSPRPVAEGPRGAPAPVGVPVFTRPGTAPAPVRRPAARRAPARRPVRIPAGRRIRVPHGGPARLPRPAPVPTRAPSPTGAPAPAARGRAPHPVVAGPRPVHAPAPSPALAPRREGAPAGQPGPDLGWALACAGLLLAAACLGRPGGRESGRAAGRASPASWLRPLLGHR